MAPPAGQKLERKERSKLERIARRLYKAARSERTALPRYAPIIKNQVLYESFSGNGMLDSPEAIFQELRSAPDMRHLSHVWALNDLDAYRSTVRKYDGDPRVRFVAHGSARYYAALARSKYLINNATFPPEFGRREGQIYLNTWHGTPLKHMGYDIPGGGPDTRNVIRNFVSADFLLSSSDFMTEQMYETAYKLRGIYRGRIIQEGSPRIDRQFVSQEEKGALREELIRRGVALEPQQQVVLYAPTWRGSFYSPTNDAMQLLRRVRALNDQIDKGRHRVLLKVHQQVYEFAVKQPELREVLVPNDIPTNAVLAATDVVLTDYSSIFFDFLATGRPILFYQPDMKAYGRSRGTYLGHDQLPGPATDSIRELAALLRQLGTGDDDDALVSHADAYEEARKRYCALEDGSAAKRVVDVVFRGITDGYDVRDDFSDGRTSILVFVGALLDNGITQSALSLLDNIDHTRFDVSAGYTSSTYDVQRMRNEGTINPNVRLFPRVGGVTASKVFWVGKRAMLRRGIDAAPPSQRGAQDRMFRDEWVRCFGNSKFDHIVDFSGYNPFWAFLLLQGEARTRSVWLHNDLIADAQREVGGRRPHERNLGAVFTTYRKFDRLVSVSSALADINRKKLAAYAGPEKFVSAANTINFRRILSMAYGVTGDDPAEVAAARANPLDLPPDGLRPGDDAGALVNVDNLPSAIETLLQRHSIGKIIDEVTRKDTILRLVPPSPGVTTFVTAGRLSPEKNHARLIRAFDLVHRDHPHTRLVIMGGGPLQESLEGLIIDLGLVSAVPFPEHQDNPFAVMAHAECFVLSSNYEGQPMALLEALVLGLPIVTTNFASVAGALPEGRGIVVEQSVEALADGMRTQLSRMDPPQPFDYVDYNHRAVQQFYDAIGVEARR